MPSDQIGFDLGAAWLYNMIGANGVAYNVTQFTGGGYHSRIGAVAAYADINAGPFSLSGRYTTALQSFNVFDLPSNGTAGISAITGFPLLGAKGARPWAAGGQAAYTFDAWWCRTQNIYLGYQASNQAAGLNIPKSRWLLGYDISVWRNADLGIEWDRNHGYSHANGGNGSNTNLVSIRAGVQFG
jgi:hypothetical protein